ncbi:Hsp20/alpha crystallin family protein [Roseateles oligotrophus]|uniref:Hsp20/alpha crystallin family protein n=1 Tax=Roseateles oligotrophus TaxID=1769250 RepID=A0ABT2YFY4_9BURK|nr:Hsp20/alpha crystallin family protein [Roseateles oligotrophus]MCV2368977.1 Hsp20/alpha crystallin family protein [Roseateles oligotrophus]
MFVIPVSRHSAEFTRQIERLLAKPERDAVALRTPPLDVSETDQAYILQLDLPGITKEAVKITIEGRRVSIDAGQAGPAPAAETSTAAERVLHRERALTRFSRSIVLPAEVNQSDSNAKLENGVLTLTLVKRQSVGASHLTVN